MKILVFTEGTIIMHASCEGKTRKERIRQSKNRVRSIHDYRYYIPTGMAVKKIHSWKKQGAEIYYLTSRSEAGGISDIEFVLKKYNFPDYQNLLSRKKGEEYKDVAEELIPDVLVEDDCESIGGELEMVHSHIRSDLKLKIRSIVVKEFGGIDHLPNKISELPAPVNGRI